MELRGKQISKVQQTDGVCYRYVARDDDFKYEHDETVSGFLYTLNWEYDVYVDSIGVDMWMGISLKHYGSETKIYVECDTFEAGIKAATKICDLLRNKGVLKE